jgi:hypothetical protein
MAEPPCDGIMIQTTVYQGKGKAAAQKATTSCCATLAEGQARQFLDSSGTCCMATDADVCGTCNGVGVSFSQVQQACCYGNAANDEGQLDKDGNCCNNAKVNACGVCDGSTAAVLDFTGVNCCSSGVLDFESKCCASGALDECNVCDGDGSACGVVLEVGMTQESAEASCEDPEKLAAIEQQLINQVNQQNDPFAVGHDNGMAAAMEEACATQVCAQECVTSKLKTQTCGMQSYDAKDGLCTCVTGVQATLAVDEQGPAGNSAMESVCIEVPANDIPEQDSQQKKKMYRRRLVAAEATNKAYQVTIPAGGAGATVSCDLLAAGAGAANSELATLLDSGSVKCSRTPVATANTAFKPLECPGVGVSAWVVDGQTMATKIVCSGHGFCRPVTGACDCYGGYTGAACTGCPIGQELRNGVCANSQSAVLSGAAADGTLSTIVAPPQVPIIPTPAPTPAPTKEDGSTDHGTPGGSSGSVVIAAEQRRVKAGILLSGISKSAFGPVRKAQFKKAVAQTVDVTEEEVEILGVDDVTTAGSVYTRALRVLTAKAAIRVRFQITTHSKAAQQKLLQELTSDAAFITGFANSIMNHLIEVDADAWAALVNVGVEPGSVADPYSSTGLLGENTNAGAGFPIAIVAGLISALVAGTGAVFFYKKRQLQGKRDLVYNSKALPQTDSLVITAQNPVSGQTAQYRNSMELGHYAAGVSGGATL